MRSRALLVDRTKGEETRRELVALGALRTDLAIYVEGNRLVLPLQPSVPVAASWGEISEREFEPRSSPGPEGYQDLLDWPAEEKAFLPRSFDVVGELVLVRVPRELEPRRFEIGAALLAFVPAVRLVGADRGVRGDERIRSVERLAGAGPWKTWHRENGVALAVDLEKAYFSPRLAREHARVADAVAKGETVYDLCCGVGPFAVTIARDGRARHITAVDANPEAIALLRESLARGGWEARVTPVVDRIERFAATAAPVERVVLNLPREGIKYAPLVAPLVTVGGHFHYYEVVDRDALEERVHSMEADLPPHRGWKVRSVHPVHPYSPSSDLVAFDLERIAE